MKYVNLGQTGLKVSPICVGCMSYGIPLGLMNWALDEAAALPILEASYKAGLNFYDTADTYSNGVSEEILGKAIRKFGWRRENFVIATKVYNVVGHTPDVDPLPQFMTEEQRDNSGYLNSYGLSRKHIFDACDASLKRLGVDSIDLYYIHRYDPHTPPEEVMGALNDLVRSGKVRYLGASSMWAHQLCQLQYVARSRGWAGFVAMQNLYNPVYREEEREMYPTCGMFGMACVPWSPLAMGFLARPHAQWHDTARGVAMGPGMFWQAYTKQDERINEEIEVIAKERGTTMAVVTLAWVLSKPFIHSPIVGMSKVERVKEAVQAIEFKLSGEEIKRIDALYKEPKNIIGHH